MASNIVGRVTQVLGAVVDVQFEGALPPILNALHVDNGGKTLVGRVVVHPFTTKGKVLDGFAAGKAPAPGSQSGRQASCPAGGATTS